MGRLEETDNASEMVRKGFRITLEYMKSRIAGTSYVMDGTLTICIIQLDNGWKLTGKSAPVDPNNYNAELGQKFAYEEALSSAWPLFAFAHLENTRTHD